ncbi:MAG: hypothetical protein ABIO63_07670 [Casimicrobiaceae bacterium]
MPQPIELFYVVHARAGDKGNDQTMCVIPYRPEDYDLLARALTAEAVKSHFGSLVKGDVTRFDVPNLSAFNFVMRDALQGGVNDSLAIDTHGKSRSSYLLSMLIDVPDDHPSVSLRSNSEKTPTTANRR